MDDAALVSWMVPTGFCRRVAQELASFHLLTLHQHRDYTSKENAPSDPVRAEMIEWLTRNAFSFVVAHR